MNSLAGLVGKQFSYRLTFVDSVYGLSQQGGHRQDGNLAIALLRGYRDGVGNHYLLKVAFGKAFRGWPGQHRMGSAAIYLGNPMFHQGLSRIDYSAAGINFVIESQRYFAPHFTNNVQ